MIELGIDLMVYDSKVKSTIGQSLPSVFLTPTRNRMCTGIRLILPGRPCTRVLHQLKVDCIGFGTGLPLGLEPGGLRHCISVQEASLEYLVRIQAPSHAAVIGSPIVSPGFVPG
jgi:hypothetical protein